MILPRQDMGPSRLVPLLSFSFIHSLSFFNKCKTEKSKHNADTVKTQENDSLKEQMQMDTVTRAGRN